MSKLFLLCLVAACAVLVEGKAFSTQEFLQAVANGDFKKLQSLISPAAGLGGWSAFSPVDLSGSVANLQPGPDTHVYGQAESSFQSYSNDNGRESKQSGGYGIINKDGAVTTYTFVPQDVFAPTESIQSKQ